MDNKRRILDISRKLLNDFGLKNLTARLICKELGISPGSFSYHYPDKSLIISTLYKEMQIEINDIITNLMKGTASILSYLEFHKRLFFVQNRYKYFYLNLFEILVNYEGIKTDYLKNIQEDRHVAKKMILFYSNQGILNSDITEKIIERLVNVGQILNNFWTIDAEIMPQDENKLMYYMEICCGLLEPYLEPASLLKYNEYFEKLKSE